MFFLAALQRRLVLYHSRWLLSVLWPWPSVHRGELAPTTLPQCRLVSNPCPAGLALAAPVLLLLSGTRRRVISELRERKGAFGGAKASQRCTKSFCGLTLQQMHCCTVAHTCSVPHHVCAGRPHIQVNSHPPPSRGPHSRCPCRAQAFSHVMTCHARAPGAQRRPDVSPLSCSALCCNGCPHTLVSSNPPPSHSAG